MCIACPIQEWEWAITTRRTFALWVQKRWGFNQFIWIHEYLDTVMYKGVGDDNTEYFDLLRRIERNLCNC